jgi:hypothetical protein
MYVNGILEDPNLDPKIAVNVASQSELDFTATRDVRTSANLATCHSTRNASSRLQTNINYTILFDHQPTQFGR